MVESAHGDCIYERQMEKLQGNRWRTRPPLQQPADGWIHVKWAVSIKEMRSQKEAEVVWECGGYA